MAATLLLCLSNLLFLPAVGLAIYRGFYTESFVYFANMVFSTVSHDFVGIPDSLSSQGRYFPFLPPSLGKGLSAE